MIALLIASPLLVCAAILAVLLTRAQRHPVGRDDNECEVRR